MQHTPDTFIQLFYGYTVIWLLIAGYVLLLARRIAKLEQRGDKHAK